MQCSQPVLSYLRNMRAAQANNHPEHAAYLFAQAMEWLDRDEEKYLRSSSLHFGVGIGLDKGTNPKRQRNEDYTFADQLNYVLPDGTQKTVGIFVVADGIGGFANGQEASRLAVHTFVDYVLSSLMQEKNLLRGSAAIKDLLIAGLCEANYGVYQRNQALLLIRGTMGTTITAAISMGTETYIASIGDSRAYLYHPGVGLKQITEDHSFVAAKVRSGEITPEQVYTDPQRNVIYRSLGEETVEIDAPVFLQLTHGDVLLLCSDGLWEMVRDPHGAAIVQILADARLSAEEMAAQLIALALRGGGHDNIGLIVAKVVMQANVAECQTLILPLHTSQTMAGALPV